MIRRSAIHIAHTCWQDSWAADRLTCSWIRFVFVSRCSHVWCRSRRFYCVLLVFFRRWGRLVMRDLIKHDALLWLFFFRLLRDTVNSSSYSIRLFSVELSYGCFYLAMISVAGIFAGVTAKFSTFFSRAFSASLRDLEDKLTTQLALSTYNVSTGDTVACFYRMSFSNFCLCLSLVALKTRWVLVCSYILT